MKKLSLLLLHLWWTTAAFAQAFLCTPYLTDSLLTARPEILLREEVMNRDIYRLRLSENGVARMNPPVLTIPVVFHVIHQGGPENIPDSIITDALNDVNLRFAQQAPFNFPNGATVNIQLCMASVDPFGNPTTGITRDSSYWAVLPPGWGSGADEMMKNVNRWNPIRYLNVWLPKQTILAMGTNAYGSYPWLKGAPSDGVVIEALSLGGSNWLLAHEIGHYLGLYHNDNNSSCVNFNCLLDGDQVCDTPPEYQPVDCAASSCSTDLDDTSGFSPFTIDTIDIANVMLPIPPCDMVFTPGQAERMYSFLSIVRNELLDAASCGGPAPAISTPVAGIGITANACFGYSFTYTGTGAEYVEWDVNADGVFDSGSDSISMSYPTAGYRTVVQRVFNGAGYDVDTIVFYAQSTGNTNFPMQRITTNNNSNNGSLLCSGSTLTLTAVPNMAQYIWSTGDTTQTITLVADSATTFSVSLTCIDSAGIVWQHCPDPVYSWTIVPSPAPLSFSPVTDDTLCEGEYFKVVWSAAGNVVVSQYITNGWPGLNQDTVFLWYNNIPDQYIAIAVRELSTYCQSWSDTLYVHFNKLIPGPLQPGYNGNTLWINDTAAFHQWYLNGGTIAGATADTFIAIVNGCYSYSAWDTDPDCATMSGDHCVTTASLTEAHHGNFVVYPNPSNGTFYLTMPQGADIASLQVIDLVGKIVQIEIQLLPDGRRVCYIPGAAPGMYVIRWNQSASLLVVQ